MPRKYLMLCYAALLLFIDRVRSSNWAQVSGDVKQNNVVPYHPTSNKAHWAKRYGMVTIVQPTAGSTGSVGTVYLLGGDTYDGAENSENFQPGLIDNKWENGYKNDVWTMKGTTWAVKGDPRLRTKVSHQKIPQIRSGLEYVQLVGAEEYGMPVERPPKEMTYDEWLRCEPFNKDRLPPGDTSCDNDPLASYAKMWSPRRFHAGAYFPDTTTGQKWIYVFGGRAREFSEFVEDRAIGGIVEPRVKDIEDRTQRFSTRREAIVYKSDVWRSVDGKDWHLVNPGCKAPQRGLVAKGNNKEGKSGMESMICNSNYDCYGDESCEDNTCVCNIWSPREQHAVSVYPTPEDGNPDKYPAFMYLSGGYTSKLYSKYSNCGAFACGDTDASAYRHYLSDVWRSSDGETWEMLTDTAWTSPPHLRNQNPHLRNPAYNNYTGRGGHQMAIFQDTDDQHYLWVFGGRGGDNTMNGGPLVYYNDVWAAPLDRPDLWTNRMPEGAPWEPRTGHQIAVDFPSNVNLQVLTIYMYGGNNNGTYLDDLWSWRVRASGDSKLSTWPGMPQSDIWRRDFTPEALFSTGEAANYHYSNHSPAINYISADSEIGKLKKNLLPTKFYEPGKKDVYIGKRIQERAYLTDEKVAQLNSQGIYTIQDLANIDKLTVLKLRGFDVPQVPEDQRYDMLEICDFRALAMAVVDKCAIQIPSLYDGEKNRPLNNVPEFGGAPPDEDHVKWHGQKNYNYLLEQGDDAERLLDDWDGCTYHDSIQGLFGPNVDTLGVVDQVKEIRDPKKELQELACKITPKARAYHQMIMFEEKLYLFGGKAGDTAFNADTWYRDAKFPTTKFRKTPKKSGDTYPWFHFGSDEAGVHFEYRVWDPYNYMELRSWTPCVKKTDIGWLDWRKGGPGNGIYRIYLRAVDPANNRDEQYIWNDNVYEWFYISPTPWDIIAYCISAFIFLCLVAYFEYRRRVKKAAMERYAMKRMRRKFKAMQRDINGKAVDWRTLYMEAKESEEANKLIKKKSKRERQKNLEKREKEKKKREKEKEKIKKKFAAQQAEAAKTGAKMQKGGAKLKAIEDDDANMSIKSKGSMSMRSKQSKKITPGEEDEDDESWRDGGGEEVELWGATSPGGEKDKQKEKFKQKKMKEKGEKGPPGPPALEGKNKKAKFKEIGAGDLKLSANTETGTKQRKVNKRFKAYEDEDGDAEEEERAPIGTPGKKGKKDK